MLLTENGVLKASDTLRNEASFRLRNPSQEGMVVTNQVPNRVGPPMHTKDIVRVDTLFEMIERLLFVHTNVPERDKQFRVAPVPPRRVTNSRCRSSSRME